MIEVSTGIQSEHDTVNELIPWFVNGTLSGDERSQVEGHLRACLVCRRAVDEEKRVRELVIQQSDAAIGIDESFSELMARVDARSPARRLARQLSTFGARRGKWAVAAGFVLAVAVVSWVVTTRTTTDPAADFLTVTDNLTESDALRVDVIFVEGLATSEREALLASFGARIVDGPSELGRHTLEFSALNHAASSIEALLNDLRSDDRIRFAARSFIGGEDLE